MDKIMQFESENTKVRLDYSQNFSRIEAVVDCDNCGNKIVIEQNIQDVPIDFINEKQKAKDHNTKPKDKAVKE